MALRPGRRPVPSALAEAGVVDAKGAAATVGVGSSPTAAPAARLALPGPIRRDLRVEAEVPLATLSGAEDESSFKTKAWFSDGTLPPRTPFHLLGHAWIRLPRPPSPPGAPRRSKAQARMRVEARAGPAERQGYLPMGPISPRSWPIS